MKFIICIIIACILSFFNALYSGMWLPPGLDAIYSFIMGALLGLFACIVNQVWEDHGSR